MLDPTLLTTSGHRCARRQFERAARVLHVTPGRVATHPSAGRPGRRRAGVAANPIPTELGARLCRHVHTVALLEDELRRDLPWWATQPHPARTTVRIAINADSLATWFIAALQAFSAGDDTLVDVAGRPGPHR